MKGTGDIHLAAVQAVYSGPEGRLWELIMGQQIHIGGLSSSMDLAQKAALEPGARGVDFCCCTGAGMRFLVRFRGAASMVGVDATEAMVDLCRRRCEDEGLADRISCVLADVCDSGLPSGGFDFVWGEDAWCYVEDKPAMIREASRLVRPGGTIAFTDWIEGPEGLTAPQARRLLSFMKFPNLLNLEEYRGLLEANGCRVVQAENTGRFAPATDLYIRMVENQLTYDVLSLIDFDMDRLQTLGGEMKFMQQLAHSGCIAQGLFVARKQ